MEAGQIDVDGSFGVTTETPYTSVACPVTPAQDERFDSPKFDPSHASSQKTKKVKGANQESHEKDTTPSVSNCYVFKSRLQEYCQKAGLATAVYDTIKEGPSHEPFFKSTVTVNNVRYDSLPCFFNRKAAEQSAAEVALIELAKFNNMNFGISQPVHETGLCKNLLQEYAQKMNYAVPLYQCSKEEREGKMATYSCCIEIGGIKYIGASASTKKEAEKKAARTALLAIQTAVPFSEDHTHNSSYTVIPQKKKVSDLAVSSKETKSPLKPKKGKFKKQPRKNRWASKKDRSAEGTTHLDANTDGQAGVSLAATDAATSEPNLAANMVGDWGMEVHSVDATDSQGKTNGGSVIYKESQSQEVSATIVVSSHVDSGNFGLNPSSSYGLGLAVTDNPSSEPSAGGGSSDNMKGQAVDTIDSQGKAHGGSVICKDSQSQEIS